MKKYFYTLLFLISFIFAVFLQFNCTKSETEKTMSAEEMVSHGKYLVNLGGCNDCHSPKMMTQMGPMPDTTKLLSGHQATEQLASIDTNSQWIHTNYNLTAWVGQWGVSFTANLTPDASTGIGNWTEEIFIKAIRTGKHMGYGRPILPPMPWPNYAELTDEDLKSIFAYLKSIPPINNMVHDPIPPNLVAEKPNVKM